MRPSKLFQCGVCNKKYLAKYRLNRHIRETHKPKGQDFRCIVCGKVFMSYNRLLLHRELHTNIVRHYRPLEVAYNSAVIVFRKILTTIYFTLEAAFWDERENLTNLIKLELAKLSAIRVAIIWHCEYANIINSEYKNIQEFCIRANGEMILHENQITDFLNRNLSYALKRVESFNEGGSGFILQDVVAVDVSIARIRPLNGYCGPLVVDSLLKIKKIDKSLQNGTDCFLRAYAYHFISKDVKNTVSKNNLNNLLYSFISKNVVCEFEMPMDTINLESFDKANSHLKSKLHVYHVTENDVFPLFISNRKEIDVVNLVFYQMAGFMNFHYSYISNFDLFFKQRYVRSNGKIAYSNSVRCPNCLNLFSYKSVRDEHTKKCKGGSKETNFYIPERGDLTEFIDFNSQFNLPVVGFFDFETVNDKKVPKCKKCVDRCTHKFLTESFLTAVCFSLVLITRQKKIIFSKDYFGKNASRVFIETLLNIEHACVSYIKQNIPMKWTALEKRGFEAATVCHICGDGDFDSTINRRKVADHNHLTGEYLGRELKSFLT